jgi:hypothetical protein
MTNSTPVAPNKKCVLKAYLLSVCIYGDRWHSATWRTNSMIVKNNQLVCNTIHSCFLRICKLNSYTLLNLNSLVLSTWLFNTPNARQWQSDMTDLYIIQYLCFKYTHTHTVYITCAQILQKFRTCLKNLEARMTQSSSIMQTH